MQTQITICDTSVLINFLNIDRLDLFQKSSYSFHIPDQVYEEVIFLHRSQYKRLQDALNQKVLIKISITHPRELEIFERLSKTLILGPGECAAIAVACHQSCDKRAIRAAAAELVSVSYLLRTQDLILSMIKEHVLEIEEADHFIPVWAKNRFTLKIQSFSELMVPSII